jgi:hypothetical protein
LTSSEELFLVNLNEFINRINAGVIIPYSLDNNASIKKPAEIQLFWHITKVYMDDNMNIATNWSALPAAYATTCV